MERVNVDLKQETDDSYDILIGHGLADSLAAELRNNPIANSYAIIADSNVANIYGKKLLDGFRKESLRAHLIKFPAGEKNKSRDSKEKIENEMISLGFRRDACIIALGGGVTGDLAGFTAATYMRGIPYMQVPTTLLAMVDSSIGGKTAVDAKGAKNAIGAFHQPKKVIMDLNLLSTLPKKELANAMAELVKHALIRDKDFFHFLEKNMGKIFELDSKILQYAVKRSCEIKTQVVIQDEKENGMRKILNYGHTIGHAIESALRYRISHGDAISIGMSCAAKLSSSLGFLDEGSAIRQNNLLEHAGLAHRLSHHKLKPKKILEHMQYDKKIMNGKMNFILLNSIGDAFISDEVSLEEIRKLF